MKMRKVVSAMLVAAMATGMVAGCGSSSDSKSDKKDAKGKVYYLNFKPEQDEQWQDLAKEYTKETGVDVTVLTAASGEYEKTLKSEMAKSNAPTLFQVNGPVGLASWKDYCYDLKDSDVAKQLTSDDFALMDGDKMSGIAYVIESYGIIYNKELGTVLNSRKPVCYYDQGLPCYQFCDRILQNCLIFRICVGSCLIKDHDRSIL